MAAPVALQPPKGASYDSALLQEGILKPPALRVLDHFFLTRADGTTASERFLGQKPRSMFAAILASVEIPPAPLRPPRRAVG